ncbi:uncharacterized protein LOC111191866 [Astyanax mexicanus]|uniref:uncharacterized protein LOC111191866 n=1 Tax=Astyanax mexicanus TaxID=7994 RepID=UPI0020CB230E|nr:uncharacterized protein LOC111191866 [Astyanax mexicanus]
MMTGYLSSKGIWASEVRVGHMLRTVNQPYHTDRCHGAKNLNPMPYNAEYMGHKLHMDQNEKLVMFGVTHVLAIDGYSSKIVGHSTMPVKNNLLIYQDVYRNSVLQHGIWDQIRVDHGREFFLTLFIQEKLAGLRFNTDRQAYIQSHSTQNHTIERIWPEVNQRVNYPLKGALLHLVDQEEIDMEDNLTKHCMSSLTCSAAQVGVDRVVKSWNAHRIPGKGIPNLLAQGGCPKKVSPDLLPDATEAANQYDQEVGASLTRLSTFGRNPFHCPEDQEAAEREFSLQCHDIALLFENAVNYQPVQFQNGIKLLVDIVRKYV